MYTPTIKCANVFNLNTHAAKYLNAQPNCQSFIRKSNAFTLLSIKWPSRRHNRNGT